MDYLPDTESTTAGKDRLVHIAVVESRRLPRESLAVLFGSLDPEFRGIEIEGPGELIEFLDAGGRIDLAVVLFHTLDATRLDTLGDICERVGDIPVVVVCRSRNPIPVAAAIERGARGCVPFDASSKTLGPAFRLVLTGEVYIPESLLRQLNADAPTPAAPVEAGDSFPSLSSRQKQVLMLLSTGAPNKVIGGKLGLREATVKVHVKTIMRKLGVTNRTQAALRGQQIVADAHEMLPPEGGALGNGGNIASFGNFRSRADLS